MAAMKDAQSNSQETEQPEKQKAVPTKPTEPDPGPPIPLAGGETHFRGK